MTLLLFLLLFTIVLTIRTQNGCSCIESTCSLGGKSLSPWCFVNESSCDHNSDWDICIDPCTEMSVGDTCTPLHSVSSGSLFPGQAEGECIAITMGGALFCSSNPSRLTCSRSSLIRLKESASECNEPEDLSNCNCLLSIVNPSLESLSCKLNPNSNQLLYQELAQCDPCRCKSSWQDGYSNCYEASDNIAYCEPLGYEHCIAMNPDKASSRIPRGTVTCDSSEYIPPFQNPNLQHPTRTPGNNEASGGDDENDASWWVIVIIVLACVLILMMAGYWIWKCVVVNRQHQAELLEMREQIRNLTASQERMEDSMIRGVSNSAQSYSRRHGGGALNPSQPGFSRVRQNPQSPHLVQGEATHIRNTHATTSDPGASTYHSSYRSPPGVTASQSQRQSAIQVAPEYCPPPQPKWDDEGPEHFVDPNEDFGPTPNVPSVVSVGHHRESEIQFEQQITAGSEGEYI